MIGIIVQSELNYEQKRSVKKLGVGTVSLCFGFGKLVPKAVLTMTRPGLDVVNFYDHEVISSAKCLKLAFQEIDREWDIGTNHYLKKIDNITVGQKFAWAGWITNSEFLRQSYFHLFLMGQDDHRFNYRMDKLCIWERQMYAGIDDSLAKFEFSDGTIFHGICNNYWCSQIGNRPAQRYRYLIS